MHWQLLALAKRVLKPQDKNLLGKKVCREVERVEVPRASALPGDLTQPLRVSPHLGEATAARSAAKWAVAQAEAHLSTLLHHLK